MMKNKSQSTKCDFWFKKWPHMKSNKAAANPDVTILLGVIHFLRIFFHHCKIKKISYIGYIYSINTFCFYKYRL